MDFTLVKEGQKEPIAESGHSDFYLRSVHLEVELEAGDYIVYVGSFFRKKIFNFYCYFFEFFFLNFNIFFC